jgi:tRNA pseudouridine38-40 synthase
MKESPVPNGLSSAHAEREANVRLVIEYDGTCYAGWQRQRGKTTIQGEVEKAIHGLTGEWRHVQAAGRTDAGVHALGQVANVRMRLKMPPAKLVHALNAHLPQDIAVLEAEVVDDAFHAQLNAVTKEYRYAILNRPSRPALLRNTVYHVRQTLDVGRMRAAVWCLLGEHDFRAFCSESRSKENTVRRLLALEIEHNVDHVHISVCADGFLYNMVRAIVGTLLQVGLGKIGPDEVRSILESRDRRRAGPNAPTRGLSLVSVSY